MGLKYTDSSGASKFLPGINDENNKSEKSSIIEDDFEPGFSLQDKNSGSNTHKNNYFVYGKAGISLG